MSPLAAALCVAALAAPAGASEFHKTLRKAESRKEAADRVEYFSRAIKAWTPANGSALLANCHFRRGEALVELYEFARAADDLDKAISLDPGNARAYLLRGAVALREDRPDAAIKHLREHLAMSPESVEGQLALGEARLRGGEHAAAAAAFRRAGEAAPKDHRPALGEARVAIAQRRWEEALAALDRAQAAARRPEPEPHAERALALVALRRREEALGEYGRALALFERELAARQRRAAPAGAVEEARAHTARAFFGRGRLLEFLERRKEALEDLGAACRLGHADACAREAALSRRAEAAPAEPKPARARPSRRPPPRDDPGDRIYAN